MAPATQTKRDPIHPARRARLIATRRPSGARPSSTNLPISRPVVLYRRPRWQPERKSGNMRRHRASGTTGWASS
jgi:hypothetical protein